MNTFNPSEDFAHGPLHVGVPVHRINDCDVRMRLGDIAQREAELTKGLAESFTTVTRYENQPLAL